MGGMPAAAALSALRRIGCLLIVLVTLAGTAAEARSGVTPERALEDAQRILTHFSDWTLYRVEGVSMAPRFESTHLLLVKPVNRDMLKPGMIALFHDDEGDLIAHTVISVDDAGIVSRGLNNRVHDPRPISSDAIIGVVVGTLAASSPIPESFGLPVALGKSY